MQHVHIYLPTPIRIETELNGPLLEDRLYLWSSVDGSIRTAFLRSFLQFGYLLVFDSRLVWELFKTGGKATQSIPLITWRIFDWVEGESTVFAVQYHWHSLCIERNLARQPSQIKLILNKRFRNFCEVLVTLYWTPIWYLPSIVIHAIDSNPWYSITS